MAGRDLIIIIEDDDDDDDDDDEDNDEISLISAAQFQSSTASCSSSKQPLLSNKRKRESNKPLYSFCGICMDKKTVSEMFDNTGVCSHPFCSDCIRQHVAVKIKENIIAVKCPDPSCKGVIGPEACRSIVPKEVLERWESILCESVIMESQKFYCPFKDCSAMLVDDGGVPITQSECPSCNRLFCAQCKVVWHCGMTCIQFQRMKKGEGDQDDKLLTNLAKKKKWMKCPKCKLFVEKVFGCNYIRCRCGHSFCYRCGKSAREGYGYHGCVKTR